MSSLRDALGGRVTGVRAYGELDVCEGRMNRDEKPGRAEDVGLVLDGGTNLRDAGVCVQILVVT